MIKQAYYTGIYKVAAQGGFFTRGIGRYINPVHWGRRLGQMYYDAKYGDMIQNLTQHPGFDYYIHPQIASHSSADNAKFIHKYKLKKLNKDWRRVNVQGTPDNDVVSDMTPVISTQPPKTTQASAKPTVKPTPSTAQPGIGDYFTIVTSKTPLSKLNNNMWTKDMTLQLQRNNPGIKIKEMRPGTKLKIPNTEQYKPLQKYIDPGIDDWRYTGNLWEDRQLLWNTLVDAQSGGRNVRTKGASTALGKGMATQLKIMDYIKRYPDIAAKHGAFVHKQLVPVFSGIKLYNRLSKDPENKKRLDPRFAPGGKLPLSSAGWRKLDALTRDMFYKDVQRAMAARDAAGNALAPHDVLLHMVKGWRGKSQADAPKYYRHIMMLMYQAMQQRAHQRGQ